MSRYLLLFVFFVLFSQSADAAWFTDRGNFVRRGWVDTTSNYDWADMGLLWKYQVGSNIRSSPSIEDLDGDGIEEIVFGSDDDYVYAVDFYGNLLWSFKTGGNVESAATIKDVDSDGKKEIFIGSDDGRLYCLGYNGSLIWAFETGGAVKSSPAVKNLGGTSDAEIVFGSSDSNIYCLNLNGEKIWEYKTLDAVQSSPVIFDIDGDDQNEIIIGSNDNILYILKTPPYKVWRYQSGGDISGTPTINYDKEVLFGSQDGKMQMVSLGSLGTSTTRRVKTDEGWIRESISISGLIYGFNITTQGPITSSMAFAPLIKNKAGHIVFGSKDKILYIAKTTGEIVEKYSLNGAIESSVSMCDLTGDGITDIIFGTNDGSIHIYNSPKKSMFSYKTNGSVRTSAAISDMNKDGKLEFALGSDDGCLYLFGFNKTLQIAEADRLFESAIKKMDIGDLDEAYLILVEASGLYEDLEYANGLNKTLNELKRITARSNLMKARSYYSQGELTQAKFSVTKSYNNFKAIGDKEGTKTSSDLYTLIDADLYLIEAQYFFDRGNFMNASIYIATSIDKYKILNNTAGLRKAKKLGDLLDISNVLGDDYDIDLDLPDLPKDEDKDPFTVEKESSKQDLLFAAAVNLFNQGKYQNATLYFQSVLEQADGSQDFDINQTRVLLKKSMALANIEPLFNQATTDYEEKRYIESLEKLGLVKSLYLSIDDDKGYKNIVKLMAEVETEKEGWEEFNNLKKPDWAYLLVIGLIGLIVGFALIMLFKVSKMQDKNSADDEIKIPTKKNNTPSDELKKQVGLR